MNEDIVEVVSSLECPTRIKLGIEKYLCDRSCDNWISLKKTIKDHCPCCNYSCRCRTYRGIANHVLLQMNPPTGVMVDINFVPKINSEENLDLFAKVG